MALRDYQQDVYDRAKESLRKHRSVICQMPCRSGKSYLMLQVCLDAAKKGSNVLILAHRNLLLEQHRELIDLSNVRINSIQTEVRHLGEYVYPDIILIDECHISAAETYIKIINYYANAKIIGYTATPCRLDGKALGEIYEDIIEGPTVKHLIEIGAISPFKHYAPKLDIDLSKVKNGDGDYNQEDLETAMLNPKIYGDIIKNYQKLADNKQAVAYCVSIKHCEVIAKLFNDAGYSAKCLHSKLTDKVREQTLQDFKDKKFKIIVSCNTISEGISLPSAEVCLMLRPTQSYALYIQQGMRALVPQPNKVAIIIDYVGNVFRHGSIDVQTEWSLTERKKCRNSSGEENIIARTCKFCLLTYEGNSRICPYCGMEQPKTERELKQEKQAELERIEAFEKKKKRIEVGTATSFLEIAKIARDRNYKPGWVLARARIKNIPVNWNIYNKLLRGELTDD